MRLYHRRLIGLLLLSVSIGACSPPQVTQGLIEVRIAVEETTASIEVPAGSTVELGLAAAGIGLGDLDRVDPPLYTVLSDGSLVRVTRVSELFTIEEVVVPFEKQVVRNEALPEGETRLIQPGVNGLQEITTRRVFENGIEISASIVKTQLLQEPVPEIVMIGSQAPFSPVAITGRLAYLSGGNAWVMETTTGLRRPVVTSGDLDGQIFRLSSDAEWLLFTRRSEEPDEINTLWAAKIVGEEGLLIDLQAANIIHFADWAPGSVLRVAYSTVEKRDTPPGWQANNDLQLVSFSTSGWVARPEVALEANSGGIYGWWGTSFAFAPDGFRLGFARPDGVGIIDLREENVSFLEPLLAIPPLQTQSDWAWVPGLAWAPTGNILFTVQHAEADGSASAEESPNFDLTALPLDSGGPLAVIPGTGMFAYPAASPLEIKPSGEHAYQLAFLQAIFPAQSDTSRYHLVSMDHDGSNRRTLFPAAGAPGLEPQQALWSPQPIESGSQAYWLACLYQGNLWLINSLSGEAFQVTGDGLLDRLDWR